MEYKYSDYLKFLQDLSTALSDLTNIQNDKINAVKLHRLEELNEAIKKEQALSLHLRGLEKRRKTILKALDLAVPLRLMSNACEAQYKEQTQIAVDEILNKNDMLTLARNSAANILEKNSALVQKALKNRGVVRPGEDLPDILPRQQGNFSKSTDFSV